MHRRNPRLTAVSCSLFALIVLPACSGSDGATPDSGGSTSQGGVNGGGASPLGGAAQGGTTLAQGGASVAQGGASVAQGGASVAQGGASVGQGGAVSSGGTATGGGSAGSGGRSEQPGSGGASGSGNGAGGTSGAAQGGTLGNGGKSLGGAAAKSSAGAAGNGTSTGGVGGSRGGATGTGGASNGGSAGSSCPFSGHVTYTLSKAANPSSAEQNAYTLITSAMDKATQYYNCYTNITKNISVSYVPSVATADGNINGSLRFGSSTTYMDYRTAMHEISHTVGIGQASNWGSFIKDGLFTGSNANAQLQAINATLPSPADTQLHADTQHFWPYGINQQSEVKSEADLINHCKMVMAIRKDLGLQ